MRVHQFTFFIAFPPRHGPVGHSGEGNREGFKSKKGWRATYDLLTSLGLTPLEKHFLIL
jgi:hypothetical protein